MKNYLSVFTVAVVVIVLMAIGIATQTVQVGGVGPVVIPETIVDSRCGACHRAPIAISGDSIYIAWPSNRTGNDELMFRASADGGTTFAVKLNLSNSTNTESQDAEIAADGDNVIVTWWERNQTTEEPVARISSDNGATFGPLLRLATNGILGQAAAED